MTCSCGQPMRWSYTDDALLYCEHGGRWGVVWRRNNEVWIRPAHWMRTKRGRHVGTFETQAGAREALERALSRGQH